MGRCPGMLRWRVDGVGEPGVEERGSRVGWLVGLQLGFGEGFVCWVVVVGCGEVFGWYQRRGKSHCHLRTRRGGGGLLLGWPAHG